MIRSIYRSTGAMFLGLAVALLCAGCGSGAPTNNPGPNRASNGTPSAVIRASEDGKVYVREGGWAIPTFEPLDIEEFEYPVTLADGRKVDLLVKNYRLRFLSVVSDDPFVTISSAIGKINVERMKEYRTDAGVFSYRFLVNRVEFDKSTGEFLYSHGSLFPFAYYDEDGDGKFESLYLDEKDRNGRSSFEMEPHVPTWAEGTKPRQ